MHVGYVVRSRDPVVVLILVNSSSGGGGSAITRSLRTHSAITAAPAAAVHDDGTLRAAGYRRGIARDAADTAIDAVL